MATPEKRENSVLFSLRELRQIEENRVQEEDDAAKTAEEQRIRARMDEERRIADEQAAQLKAQMDEEKRIREQMEHRVHEGNVREREAQARAQAEAQAMIDQQRLQHEMEIRKVEVAKKRPTWLLVVAGVLVVAIGLAIYLIVQRGKEKDAADRKHAAEVAEKDAIIAEKEKEIGDLQNDMEDLGTQLEALDKEMEQAMEDATSALESGKTADAQAAKERVAGVKKKKAKVKEQQEEVKKKITLSKECLANPLGCKKK